METRARLSSLRRRLFELHGRQARPASASFNLLKTSVQTVVMWAIFLVIGPLLAWQIEGFSGLERFRFAFEGQFLLGTTTFLLSGIIALLSAYYMVTRGDGTPFPMDATHKLVIEGPYRYIRNPMAFSSLWQGAAIGIALGSPLILIYIGVGALMWNYLARPWEESDLERKFGDEYRHYCQQVRCWAPRLRAYTRDSYVTTSRSTVSATRSQPRRPHRP